MMAHRLLDCVPLEAASRAVLLVVPNWSGCAPLDTDHEATRSLLCAGTTYAVHGYTHSLGPSMFDSLWFGTENESEFARLDAEHAEHRLTLAIAIFRRAFRDAPRWFCAPRWQASLATRSAVRRAGLGLLDRDEILTADGRRISSPVLWFDDGARLLAQALGTVQRVHRTARALSQSSVLRVALHPRDALRPTTRDRISALFDRLDREEWEPATLDEVAALT